MRDNQNDERDEEIDRLREECKRWRETAFSLHPFAVDRLTQALALTRPGWGQNATQDAHERAMARPSGEAAPTALRSRIAQPTQCQAAHEHVGWCDLFRGHDGNHGRAGASGDWIWFPEA